MCQNAFVFPETYFSWLTNKTSPPQRNLWENLDESKYIKYEKLYHHIPENPQNKPTRLEAPHPNVNSCIS